MTALMSSSDENRVTVRFEKLSSQVSLSTQIPRSFESSRHAPRQRSGRLQPADEYLPLR